MITTVEKYEFIFWEKSLRLLLYLEDLKLKLEKKLANP